MGDKLIMSGKERKRKVIMEGVINRQYTLKEGANRMGVSYRQAKRIFKRYKAQGDAGLLHKHRGSPSGHAKPTVLKQKVLTLYQEKYRGFGPTLAAEFMEEEESIRVNAETLRLWLKSEGLWLRQRKHRPYRHRREPKEHFGEMLQIDGSDHEWFGPGEPTCCLLNMVDDATSTTLAMLDGGETTWVLLKVLMKWIKRYGVPQSVYVDLKSVYVSPSQDGLSVFEEVCQKLDIKVIHAYSAQAKGRVERKHGVFQDRFVKELQLKGIKELGEANKLLEKKVLKKFNEKFAKPAKEAANGHRDAKLFGDLQQIICWETTRQVRNDYTFQYENVHYQILKEKEQKLKPKQKVVVRKHLSGKISLWYEGNRLSYKRLTEKAKREEAKREEMKDLRVNQSHLSLKNKNQQPWSVDMIFKRNLTERL